MIEERMLSFDEKIRHYGIFMGKLAILKVSMGTWKIFP